MNAGSVLDLRIVLFRRGSGEVGIIRTPRRKIAQATLRQARMGSLREHSTPGLLTQDQIGHGKPFFDSESDASQRA